MKKPLVVNLYGPPGCGKSTGAAYIFYELKKSGINCELVAEFAKDKTWEHNKKALSVQEYVFGKQSYRMARCRDDVDVIITDSPLILSIIYNHNEALDESFEKVIYNIYNTYDNYDYLINRVKPYNPKGRNETEEESNKIMPKIENLLIKYNIDYELINGDDSGYNYIVRKIKENLKIGAGELIMNKLKLLQEALDNITQVNKSDDNINIPTNNLEYAIKRLSISEDYNIPFNELYSNYSGDGAMLCSNGLDFIVSSNIYIANSVNHFEFDKQKEYIQLINGNIGRLMFSGMKTDYYGETNDIWEEFKNELISYNPVDYDDMNFNYVYTMEDGIRLYKDFDKIYTKYQKKFDEAIKDVKIKFLEQQIEKLKSDNDNL